LVYLFFLILASFTTRLVWDLIWKINILFSLLIIILISFVITPFLYFTLWKVLLIARNMKLFKDSKTSLIEREYHFYDDEIKIKSEYEDKKIKYKYFKNLKESKFHIFLFTNPLQATILPKKHFFKEQIEFIKTKIQSTN